MREDRIINIVFIVAVLGLSFAGIFYLSCKMLH
jgi:hypothetical protein